MERRNSLAMKVIILFALLAFLQTPFIFAQDSDAGMPYWKGNGESPQETEEQKLARMLNAFDNIGNYEQGILLVSFETSITKEKANQVLQKFSLKIEEKEICANVSTENPDGTVVSDTQCYMEGWYDLLKYGKVLVPAGQEKVIAEQLYNESEIIWVEPFYTATTLDGITGTGNGNDGGDNTFTPPKNNTYTVPNPNVLDAGIPSQKMGWIWIIVGLVIMTGIYFFVRKNNN